MGNSAHLLNRLLDVQGQLLNLISGHRFPALRPVSEQSRLDRNPRQRLTRLLVELSSDALTFAVDRGQDHIVVPRCLHEGGVAAEAS